MSIILKSTVESLADFSKSLRKKSILVEKPWTLIDSDDQIQRLIFKKNKDQILSKNGQVEIGHWDYFPQANSILIDRVTDKILCNEAFIDDAVIILKKDGTQNEFFSLANQNLLPDLDIINYLIRFRKVHVHIDEKKLADGSKLEILLGTDENTGIYTGKTVLINQILSKD